MISKDIAAKLAEKHNMPKGDAKTVVDSAFDIIADALVAGEKVVVKGVGTLNVIERAARKGRNPATGAEIDIPARRDIKFKIAGDLKERM